MIRFDVSPCLTSKDIGNFSLEELVNYMEGRHQAVYRYIDYKKHTKKMQLRTLLFGIYIGM